MKTSKNPIPFFKRIRFKLIAAFMIPVFFIIILGWVSYNKASKQIVSSYEVSANQTMDMMNQYLTLAFDTVQSGYKEYINDSELQKFFKGLLDGTDEHGALPGQYMDDLSHKVTTDALISNIYFISDTQVPITTSQTKAEKLYSAYAATAPGQMAVNDTFKFFLFGNQCDVDEQLATDSSKYGARIVRSFNGIKALMIIDIKKSVVDDTLSSLDAGDGSIVGLITMDGNEYLSSVSAEVSGNAFVGKSYVDEAFTAEASSGFSYVEDNEYLFLYSRLDNRQAMICALIPQETIIGQTADIQRLSMILVVLASVTAIALGSILAKQYGGDIYYMINNLKKVSEGDLTVEVSSKRNDEFRLLANGISDMVSHMKRLVSGIKDVNTELGTAVEGMTAASESFLQSSRNIQSEISEMSQGMENMDRESEDCLGQMDSLSGRIVEVADNSEQINDLAKNAEQVIATGMNTVIQLKESAQSTTQVTSSIIDTIDKLSEKSKSIGAIIVAINEIAEQTNLLSLNASIEAARAGEAGKGFAVVAQEIQKLADECIKSSDQIARIIDEIEANTVDAANVARQAEDIVESQQQSVELTTESFEQIGAQVRELLGALSVINDNVASMEEERTTTLSSITAISAISAQSAAGSANVYDTANKQLASIEELDRAANVLEKRAHELSALLEGFTV